MRTAERLKRITPYMFATINEKRAELEAQGIDVVSLAVGDPDAPTPDFIVDAMAQAIRKPENQHYPAYAGSPEYRAACARYMDRRFGVPVDPDTEVLALIGSKEGLAHLSMAYVDPGEYVLVPSVGYLVYPNTAILNDASVYHMPATDANGYLADFTQVPEDVLAKTKIMFLGYPHNPTGATAPVEYLDAAIDFCLKHRILLAFDNAYCDICFDGYRAPSILERPHAKECCIEFFSASKSYNMTGWRIGFACGNAEAVKALGTIKNNIDTGVFTAIQEAAIVAFDSDQSCVAENCARYARRRDYLVPSLNRLGLSCRRPQASIYVWTKVPEGCTSAGFAARLLEEAHVAVAPGSGYGPDGEGYIRLSLAVPDDRLALAVERMERMLGAGPLGRR